MGEFTEVESGKRSDRPELEKALKACRKHKAKLVIAKLMSFSQRTFHQRPDGARGVKLGGPRLPAINETRQARALERAQGHCANSLGIGWNVGPLRGCGVERAPGRDAKRRAVVLPRPSFVLRTTRVGCAISAGPFDDPAVPAPRRPLPRRCRRWPMTNHPIDADVAKFLLDDPALDRIIAEVGGTITKPDRDVLRQDLLFVTANTALHPVLASLGTV